MKNFFTRLITSVFIVATVLGAFLLRQNVDSRFMHILFYFFAVVGSFEMIRALGDRITTFTKCVIIAVSFTLTPCYVFIGTNTIWIIVLAATLLMLAAMVFDFENTTIEKTACGFFALFYPNILLVPMMMANDLPNYGFIATVLIFAISPVADALAYIVGSLVKGPKLCEKVSPKKTISGAIGGLIGGMAISVVVWAVFGKDIFKTNTAIEVTIFILIGFIASICTELGDLIEASIKRKFGIKDMGKLLPGHGGILDRIDGNMICALFIYAVFAFIG